CTHPSAEINPQRTCSGISRYALDTKIVRKVLWVLPNHISDWNKLCRAGIPSISTAHISANVHSPNTIDMNMRNKATVPNWHIAPRETGRCSRISYSASRRGRAAEQRDEFAAF